MIEIEIPKTELFDEETNKFINIEKQTLVLEHSLISLSRWESKWLKPFLDEKNKKTSEETLDYIRCMSIKPLKSDVLLGLTQRNIKEIVDYIDSPMTASTVTFFNEKKNKKNEKITSELIYYWMICAGIPFECEKWHLNRLLMLIKIFSAKNSNEKMGKVEAAKMRSDLNKQRRKKLKSKG